MIQDQDIVIVDDVNSVTSSHDDFQNINIENEIKENNDTDQESDTNETNVSKSCLPTTRIVSYEGKNTYSLKENELFNPFYIKDKTSLISICDPKYYPSYECRHFTSIRNKPVKIMCVKKNLYIYNFNSERINRIFRDVFNKEIKG